MRWFLIALALALAAAPVPAAAEKPIKVITKDGGGNVNTYRQRRAEYARKYREVQVLGKCNSACVMFLTLPNACIGPKAVIGIHGTQPKTGIGAVDYWLDMRVGQYFRGEMRRRFETTWRHRGGAGNFYFFTSKQIRRLDPQIPLCKNPVKVKKKKKKKKTGG